jgi:hypothetical protein
MQRRDLSISSDRVGDVQVPQGNLPAALTSHQASLAIADRLAKSRTGRNGNRTFLGLINKLRN